MERQTILHSRKTYFNVEKAMIPSLSLMEHQMIQCCAKFQGDLEEICERQKIITLYPPRQITMTDKYFRGTNGAPGLKLICQISSANPRPKVSWKRINLIDLSEKPLDTFTDKIDNSVGGLSVISTLMLDPLNSSFNKNAIQCLVEQEPTKFKRSINYDIVFIKAEDVKIITSKSFVIVGDDLEMECRLPNEIKLNSDNFKYNWLKCPTENCPIKSQMEQSLSNERLLKLKNLKQSDSGQYRCQIYRMDFLESEAKFNLDVKYRPVIQSKFKQKLYATNHQSPKFTISYLSNPKLKSIKWFFVKDNWYSSSNWEHPFTLMKARETIHPLDTKHGRIVEQHTFQKDGNQVSGIILLQLNQLIDTDYGFYICQMSNDVSHEYAYFWLVHPDSSKIPNNSIKAEVSKGLLKIYYRPPKYGHYSHLILEKCFGKFNKADCQRFEITNPESGYFSTRFEEENMDLISLTVSVFQGHELRSQTKPFYIEKLESSLWYTNPLYILAMVIGSVVLIFILLFGVICYTLTEWRKQNQEQLEAYMALPQRNIYSSIDPLSPSYQNHQTNLRNKHHNGNYNVYRSDYYNLNPSIPNIVDYGSKNYINDIYKSRSTNEFISKPNPVYRQSRSTDQLHPRSYGSEVYDKISNGQTVLIDKDCSTSCDTKESNKSRK